MASTATVSGAVLIALSASGSVPTQTIFITGAIAGAAAASRGATIWAATPGRSPWAEEGNRNSHRTLPRMILGNSGGFSRPGLTTPSVDMSGDEALHGLQAAHGRKGA